MLQTVAPNEPLVPFIGRFVSLAMTPGLRRYVRAVSRAEKASQRLDKVDSAPGSGCVPEVSDPPHVVHWRVRHREERSDVAIHGRASFVRWIALLRSRRRQTQARRARR